MSFSSVNTGQVVVRDAKIVFLSLRDFILTGQQYEFPGNAPLDGPVEGAVVLVRLRGAALWRVAYDVMLASKIRISPRFIPIPPQSRPQSDRTLAFIFHFPSRKADAAMRR